MILQYGLKNNSSVTYVEADMIETQTISLSSVEGTTEEAPDGLEMRPLSVISSKVRGSDIYYIAQSKDVTTFTLVTAVTLLSHGNSPITYVFDATDDAEYNIFLLNNNGKTIVRL